MVLVNLSFWNGPIMLPIWLMKEWLIYRISHIYDHTDHLLSKVINNALNNVRKDFVVVPIDKGIGNITPVWKRFHTFLLLKS